MNWGSDGRLGYYERNTDRRLRHPEVGWKIGEPFLNHHTTFFWHKSLIMYVGESRMGSGNFQTFPLAPAGGQDV
jgi:hypothetical protein